MTTKQKRGKLLPVICVLTVSAGLAAGCGDGKDAGGQEGSMAGQSSGTAAKGPTTITMMMPYYSTEAPKNNPIIQKLEELTNTKLNITWVPDAAYKDKLSVSLASGDLPQATVVSHIDGGIYAPSIVSGIRSGAFWEIGPMLKDYPNLSTKLNKDVMKNASHDGKYYSLYRSRVLANGGFVYRQDWLDKLGLQEPKTLDDLYNVIKAFALNDPDGNGKNDTYGLISRKGFNDLNMLAGFFGAGNEYEKRDGKLIPSFFTDEHLNAMKFMKRLYDEKLMNGDFAVTESSQSKALFEGGKGGGFISTSIRDAITHDAAIKKTNPNGQVGVVSRIQGPKGERIMASPGYNGIFMFPKNSVKTEEQMRGILSFFDKMFEKDVANLLGFGIEGMHYHLEDGLVVGTEQEKALSQKDGAPIPQLSIIGDEIPTLKAKSTPLNNKVKQMNVDNVDIAISNPALSTQSPTFTEKSGELDKIKNDARMKFILGEIDEAGWKKEVEKWLKAGGEKGLEELNAEYAKLK
ncbi:putative aldouronate transport system substrate-binding protein [Paenibacillus sp. 1_12]|uniref:extracellular solute-binding protein n=1 Tax=Paenibacillus sp. 1_12 TaxID=1566278 RepID=UPI0008E2678B|nr:extracellular solute-binding protein [Paenibacillus sp. 1_12]SFM15901.1 putative aldouronate transport system substrate-binding protein [Paenibacillus sp. 1_12]